MAADIELVEDKLSTYDFVRETGRDRYFAARDREIAMLQNPAGGIRTEFAEAVTSCPVCGLKEFEFLFEKQGFQIMRCAHTERCGHVFANPQISEEALMEAYRGHAGNGEEREPSANDLWIEVLLSEANQQYDKTKYQRGLVAMEDALRTCTEGLRKVLDIGCSVGHFLAACRDKGWKTIGLELNQKAIVHARDVLGLDVRAELLNEADLPDASFDAVTLWGVIEHLKCPVETLKEIVRVLKPGGALLTFCPNAASLVCRVLRAQAATFDGRNHPSYFTPRSIRLAMELAGLETVAVTFHQPDLDAVLNYLEGRDPYIRTSDKPTPLTDFFSGPMRDVAEEFILKHGFGYKMMTINRK